MNDLVNACANLRNIAKNTKDVRLKAEIYKTFIDIYCVIKSLPSDMFGVAEDNRISDIMERLEKLENDYLGTNDALVNAIRDHEERLNDLEEETSGFDPVTDVPGVAELMWKVAEETTDTGLKLKICQSFVDHGKDLESAQYDEESDGYKYSAAEIAQKLSVLSEYCDIELKDTCTIADIANFLENVELDADGNVWLNLQVDERTIKRFRLNREAAGQITM